MREMMNYGRAANANDAGRWVVINSSLIAEIRLFKTALRENPNKYVGIGKKGKRERLFARLNVASAPAAAFRYSYARWLEGWLFKGFNASPRAPAALTRPISVEDAITDTAMSA